MACVSAKPYLCFSQGQNVTWLEEAIRIYRALWSSKGEPISRDSEFWPLHDAVFPLARHEWPHPQLLMVGGTERQLSLTGELCDGWLTFLPGGVMDDPAMLSGMVGAVKAAAYVFSGICAAVGSIILTARVASGQPSLGTTLPLESVAAVVLGGISLFGGRGSVVGVAFGVLFVSILSNGLNLLNVPSYTQMMVIGGALILAVALDQAFIDSRMGKKVDVVAARNS